MIEIDRFLTEGKYKSRMILQVHDELVFEVHETEIELMMHQIRAIMEGVFP